MSNSELTLLLVGSAGNGKSATGNTILRQQAFKTTASTFSTSSQFAIARGFFQNVKINVVDGPGVETDRSAEEVLNLSITGIKQALNLCGHRFSALVIVLKYGTRFTKQESDFIKSVKGILGKNVIRDFGVCIMTHGDNFQADNEDENLNFIEWCKQQGGDIRNLFQECNYRCVLFNNRTNDERLKDSQVSELLAMVPRNVQYSEDKFRAANADLQKLIIETKMPSILKETNEFIEGKRNIVKTIQSYLDVVKQIQSYNDLLNQVNEFEKKLSERYHGRDSIPQPLNVLNVFKMDVNMKLKTCERSQQLQQEKALQDSMKPSRSERFSPAASSSFTHNDPFSYRYEDPLHNNTAFSRDYINKEPTTQQLVQTGNRRPNPVKKELVLVLFLLAFVVVFYLLFSGDNATEH